MEKPIPNVEHPKLYRKITLFLHEIGISANLTGYQYIRYALLRIMDDPSVLYPMTRGLYPEIAAAYHTSAFAVEKAIRYAIEAAYLRQDPEILYKHFKYIIDPDKGKPSNKVFLACTTDIIRCQHLLP